MKSFDLNAMGVQEMNTQEMSTINGGSWISDAWDAVCDAAEWVWEHAFVRAYNGVIEGGISSNL